MKRFLSSLFLILFSGFVMAATPAEQLTSLLGNLQSMRAQFTQEVLNGKGKVLQKSNGQMALQRPGKFRWITQHPTQQQLIADGKKVWLYDLDLQQVTVQKQDTQSSQSPAMLLSGSVASLTRNFKITFIKDSENNFELQPVGKKAMFKNVQLFFTGNQLTKMRLTDSLGQTSLLTFSQIENNPALPENLFHFQVPKGVDVVQQ